MSKTIEQGEASRSSAQEPSAIDRYFGLTASGTSVATELRAGLATFLTMAYIMFVNPAILEKAGMDHGGVRGDVPRSRREQRHHGSLRQLSHRARARHGPQRLFRLHHGAGTRR